METLVVVAQHRNQYYGRVKVNGSARYGVLPDRHFKDISCRAFQSRGGILPTPFENLTSPVTEPSPFAASDRSLYSPKTPASSATFSANAHSFDVWKNKNALRSSPISIGGKSHFKELGFDDDEVGMCGGSLSFSELWAGPAYSNSPPPSSLPIPKFSVRPKRTVSLDLPHSNAPVKVHPMAKSAPAFPSREVISSTLDMFRSVDSATMTLRRILNLDVTEEDVGQVV